MDKAPFGSIIAGVSIKEKPSPAGEGGPQGRMRATLRILLINGGCGSFARISPLRGQLPPRGKPLGVFCISLIALHSTIPDPKRISPCKVKSSAAVHLCRQFILGNVSPPVLEDLLLRQLSSIRPGKNFPRGSSFRKLVSFSYKIA